MKKFKFGIITAMSVLLLSCNNSNNVAAEEGEIQIDPALKELGELNVLLFQYDDIGNKFGDCVAVKSKKKWGLINIKGDTILDFKYDKIEHQYDSEFWKIKIKNKEKSQYSDCYDVGLADAKGKIIFPIQKGNQNVRQYGDGLFEVYKGGKEPHLYNNKGEEIILGYNDGYDFYLSDIKKINDKTFMVFDEQEWFRAIYDKGADPPFKVDSVGYRDVRTSVTSDWCFVINDFAKWGIINSLGELIVPHKYCDVKFLGGKNDFVQNEEGKWGMLTGDTVKAYYDNFIRSIDEYSIARDGETNVILDSQGNIIFRGNDIKDEYFFYSNGMFLGKHCLYDTKGNKVATYNDSLNIQDYVNGYVVVRTGSDKYGIVDKSGKFVVSPSNYMNPQGDNNGKLILLTRNISDVVVDDERIIVNVTDIFDTEKGDLVKTKFDLSMSKQVDGLFLGEVEGRHIYVNEEGKTGILNLDEVLITLAEKKEQSKKQEQEDGLESIKKQLVETINKENGREVLSSTYAIHNLEKLEDGTYRAEFYDKQVYETFTYEIFGIKVDKDFNVQDFDLKVIMIRPHANKPDGGITGVNELVDRITGRKRY